MRDIRNLYNWQIKKEYLEELENENMRKVLFSDFKRISEVERDFFRDVYDMNIDQLEELLYRCRFKTETAVIVFLSKMLSYTKWAAEKGYANSNLPPIVKKITSVASKYVFKTISAYYTQEQLFDIYETMNNRQDVMIIQCIFEGIKGESYTEILNLKSEDIFKQDGKYYVNLYDTKRGTERLNFEITEFLYDLMLEMSKTSEIKNARGTKDRLIPSPYIIRKTVRGNKNKAFGEKLDFCFISQRGTYIKKSIGNKNFNLQDIEKSGIMHYLNELMKDKEDKIATKEEYKKISDKFSVGKYTHSVYKKKEVNYTIVKSKIDLDFYKENYGDIILE